MKYRGTLIDGTEFDASDKHGGTATFPVDGVIKGWTEALQKMKVGSKWQLFIPSELAYGDRRWADGHPAGLDVDLRRGTGEHREIMQVQNAKIRNQGKAPVLNL